MSLGGGARLDAIWATLETAALKHWPGADELPKPATLVLLPLLPPPLGLALLLLLLLLLLLPPLHT